MKRNFVLAITGASGATYAIRTLEVLTAAGCDVHLTISSAAAKVLKQELDLTVDLDHFQPACSCSTPRCQDPKLQQIRAMAGISSESSNVLSVGTGEPGTIRYYHYRDYIGPDRQRLVPDRRHGRLPLLRRARSSAIVHGTSSNLIHRAAEVHLKERRKLILVPRETPLSLVHLENMKRAAEAGAVILPAMPGFYHGVTSIQDLVDFVVARICDQLGILNALIRRWGS